MKLLITICVLLLASFSFSQQAFMHQKAKDFGIRTTQLDSTYKSAIHSDPALAVFSDQEAVSKAYSDLLADLGKFLAAKNFEWEQAVSGFNRIYFDKDGSIDYFVYIFRGDLLSPQQVTTFDQLLNEFIQTYKISLTANEKFAQCSPVTYMPAAKE